MQKFTFLIFSTIIFLILSGCNKNDVPSIQNDFIAQGEYAGDYWPTSNWRLCSPENVGMNSEILVELDKEVLRLRESNFDIHSILIVKDGYIIAEKYYSSEYGRDSLHRIHSITKSITSALVGITIKQNFIPHENVLLSGYFNDYEIDNTDKKKQQITIKHLLSMSAGYDWNELNYSYSDERNTFRQWVSSNDRVEFVLDRPMSFSPGQTFNYNTGISHVLSALIQETTSIRADSFALQNLFNPIGIKKYEWPVDNNGVAYGGNGMKLAPRDLARFGYLYLNDGRWDGVEIVPPEWIKKSTIKQITANSLLINYGYQWWIRNNGSYSGIGYAGQWLTIFPDNQLIVVFNNQFDEGDGEQWNTPERLLNEFIIPAIL